MRPLKPQNVAIGKRISALRERMGLTQADLAKKIGVERGAVGNWEAGRGVKRENLVALAALFAVSVEQLTSAAIPEPVQASPGHDRELVAARMPEKIPVVGTAEAGVFRAVDIFDDVPTEYVVAVRDDRFPHARHMAFRIQGDSMDLAGILPGDTVIAVDYTDAGVALRDGQTVVVERTANGGHMKELTIKRVKQGDGYTDFVPVSSNQRHKPIRVQHGDMDNGVSISIVALVVEKVTRFEV